MGKETNMTMSTYAEQFNQFTPQEFNNPLFGNLNVFIDPNKQCWFIGVEVARMLGYSQPRDVIAKMGQQYKMIVDIRNASANYRRVLEEYKYNPQLTLISEQGMLSLIMRSNLPNIQQFQDWVYNVIVSIRQYGSYISPQLKTVMEIDEEQLWRIAKQKEEENRILKEQNLNLQQQNQQYTTQINQLNQRVQGQQNYIGQQQDRFDDYRDAIRDYIQGIHQQLDRLEHLATHHRMNYRSNIDYITDNIDEY